MDPTAFDAGIPAFGTGVLYAVLVTAALAFALAVTAAARGPVAGARHLRAARLATLGTCSLIGLDVLTLAYGFLSHDFRIRYVAHYSDRSMPLSYLVAALWGGQDGSLLWWTFLLSLYTAACVVWLKGRHRELAPVVLATLLGVLLFFGVLMAFAANPFAATFGGAPPDGDGLNPSLQNFYMAIHPPSLYTGFVGCAVPFAFAVAALVTGRLGEEWVLAVRRWVLFAWLFLSIGNILGMLWAYEELGWGGFWAWDPVENAACLPWWTLTAYMHSVMIQERRGFLKVWNVSLLLFSFFLTIFGTFLTRSGLISSIHSFAQSGIGTYFVVFMVVLAVFCTALVVWRLPKLSEPAALDAVLSREAMFVANNWLLLGISVFIAVATVWPKVSEALWDERLTVGASFYNGWLSPVGLALFGLVGVGMLTPWRKGTSRLLLQAFRGPLLAFAGAFAAHLLFGRRVGLPAVVTVEPIYDIWTALKLGPWVLGHVNVGRSLAWLDGHLPPVAVGLFAFNLAALAQEFWRGTAARMRAKGEPAPVALTRLVGRNRRRYGGYIVHLGFALMMVGWLGAAWRQEAEATIAPGESFRLGRYTLRYDGSGTRRDPNKREVYARITAFRDGREYARLAPARFIYTTHPEMPTTEVAIATSLREDLYLVMASVDADTHVAHLKAFVNPFTIWIWLGGIVLILGVLVGLWPEASLLAGSVAGSGARALAALVVLGLCLAPAAAQAQNRHNVSAGPPPVGITSMTPRERQVFDKLLCMCGDCQRLPLATCTCDFASQQRARMRLRLARGDAPGAIVQDYVDVYGAASLAVPPDRGHNKALYLLPVAALTAGAGLVVHLARRWARARAPAPPAPSPGAEAPSPGHANARRDAYDARIDEELRGLDD
ncbi:MAG: cytochrome c biogenesis protein CcsA [Deltaproteobacteria bacterium]|nr:cytochrome c biogenesis protein CcsA [Deltaproteobacteria bacterium]